MTMRYFASSTGRTCGSCHATDKATNRLDFAAKTDAKKTSREMMKIVQAVNGGGDEFGKTKIKLRNLPSGSGPSRRLPDRNYAHLRASATRE